MSHQERIAADTGSDATERSAAIDALRCLAAVSIIAQHVTSDGMLSRSPALATAINGLSLWGLPFFFLVSGLVQRRHLASNVETLSRWITSRAKRLLIPYLAWSAVYVGIVYLLTMRAHGAPPTYDWVAIVFTGGALGPLWFLPMLFYVSVAARAVGPRLRFTTLVVSGLAALLVFVGLTAGIVVWGFWLLSPWYLFLYLLGTFVPDFADRAPRPSGRASVALASALLAITAVCGLVVPNSRFAPAYAALVTILPALAALVLVWAVSSGWELAWAVALTPLAPLLIGVYLTHPGWLLLWERFVRPETTAPIIWLPLTLVIITALAFGTSAILRRIPGLRAIV